MQKIAIVNASRVLSEAKVRPALAALQKQIDRDFLPAWAGYGDWIRSAYQLLYVPLAHSVPKDAWPIYLNRHSVDEGVLGWHTDEGGKVYGRVFVGDCIHYGVSWSTDLGHEVLETILDPEADRTWTMSDGRKIDLEACDAVEADALAYEIDKIMCTDFVLPSYFSSAKTGQFDFRGALKGPAPALTPGGYVDVDGQMIEADRLDGLRGRRSVMFRWRRALRRAPKA